MTTVNCQVFLLPSSFFAFKLYICFEKFPGLSEGGRYKEGGQAESSIANCLKPKNYTLVSEICI
jgi:hypothetical protein